MKFTSVWILGVTLFVMAAPRARAQDASAREPTTLADLLTEVEKNNPQILAARHGWQSAKQIPTQASTLPDPQLVLQQTNVGSPRPFAGYTNSDFAYIGLGISQDLPYPGKLRLKGEIAKKDADASQQKYESVRRAVHGGCEDGLLSIGLSGEAADNSRRRRTTAEASCTGGGVSLSERHGKSAGRSASPTRTHQAASRNQYESAGSKGKCRRN